MIFIEWMSAANVLVLVGRPLYLLERFLHFRLCAAALLSMELLATLAVMESRDNSYALPPIVVAIIVHSL